MDTATQMASILLAMVPAKAPGSEILLFHWVDVASSSTETGPALFLASRKDLVCVSKSLVQDSGKLTSKLMCIWINGFAAVSRDFWTPETTAWVMNVKRIGADRLRRSASWHHRAGLRVERRLGFSIWDIY
jgi:hypothetical protein